MATATKTKVKIVKEVDEVVLTLTEKEAELLRYIMQSIGGSPENSFRSITDDIEEALSKAVPNYSFSKYNAYAKQNQSSIWFEDGGLGE